MRERNTLNNLFPKNAYVTCVSSFNLISSGWLVGWLCLASYRQRGHLETAPPFTVPCEGLEAR